MNVQLMEMGHGAGTVISPSLVAIAMGVSKPRAMGASARISVIFWNTNLEALGRVLCLKRIHVFLPI